MVPNPPPRAVPRLETRHRGMLPPVDRPKMERPPQPRNAAEPDPAAARGAVEGTVRRQIPRILRIGGTRRRDTVRKRAVDPNIRTARPQSPREIQRPVRHRLPRRLAPRSTAVTAQPAAHRAAIPQPVRPRTTRRIAPAPLAPADAPPTATVALRVAPRRTGTPPRHPRTLKPKTPSTPIGPITWPSTTPKTRNCAA